jgi:hypothetical protein
VKPAIRTYAVLPILLLITSFSGLEGQTIRGRVLLAGDTVGVDGVTIELAPVGQATLVQTQSDEGGFFQLPAPQSGRYNLALSRIGFSPFVGAVAIGENEMVEVEIRMAEQAIPLDPLVITARRTIQPHTLDEYYDRMERNKRRGVGNFLTREEVENAPTASTPLLLATTPTLYLEPTGNTGYGIRMRSAGSYCTPEFYLDGLLTSWERLPPMEEIEGVEIYRTSSHFEVVEGYYPSDCGAVFLWRRADWGNPFKWGKLVLAGGFVALAAVLVSIF